LKLRWLFTIALTFSLGLGACSPSIVGAPFPKSSPFVAPTSIISPTTTRTQTSATPQSIPTQVDPTATASKTATASPTPLTCWSNGGSIELGQIESDQLDSPLVYRIYLPACYDHQPEREYPVLYLFHGQSYTDEQWDRLGIDETADRLIAEGDIAPLIMVMPFEEDDRTPPPENIYGMTIVRELLPHIDEKYHTFSIREFRALGGLSRGGNWAINIGLTNWSKFGIIGAHSTPSFVTDGPPRIREILDVIPRDMLPRIYMDSGADDLWREYTLQLEAVFAEENIPHEWHQFEGAHEEEYWASHLEDYLLWYTQGW
jgi:enterochelin esterase-like enzyme